MPVIFTAVELTALIVLPVPVAVTVPPPVALNAARPLPLVLSVSVLVKLIVVPVLFPRLIPSLVPVEETVPSNEIVPLGARVSLTLHDGRVAVLR